MTEQEQIKEAFEDLLKSLRKETSKENRQKIKEAFEFANEAHKGVNLIFFILWLLLKLL